MQPDLWSLYQLMLKSRLFEQQVIKLWNDGNISGEMHLAIGEEAICAGIIPQLQDGDALALDHRGTPPLLMRGIDPVLLLNEFLGKPEGLCSGMGGHMHLFSLEHLAASSGIVGASGPAAVGFALSAQYLRSGKIAVAFFGEGAVNQGMLMESVNMAVAWKLPVIFVCKDNEWSIATPSSSVTGGNLVDRMKGFGINSFEKNGSDVMDVWELAQKAIKTARKGGGPTFLHLHCVRPEGHFIGDPLIRIARHPLKELKKISGPLIKSTAKLKGSSITQRSESLGKISAVLGKTIRGQLFKESDPVELLRQKLINDKERLIKVENLIAHEIQTAVDLALKSAD